MIEKKCIEMLLNGMKLHGCVCEESCVYRGYFGHLAPQREVKYYMKHRYLTIDTNR